MGAMITDKGVFTINDKGAREMKDMPYLWELAENQLKFAGERDRTINIKIAINTARMMVERERGIRFPYHNKQDLMNKYRDLENEYVQTMAIFETIADMVIEGKEPGDFMMSFPTVRKIWESVAQMKAKGGEPCGTDEDVTLVTEPISPEIMGKCSAAIRELYKENQ